MVQVHGISAGRWRYVGICALAFFISAGVRLLEAPLWEAQIHRVDGEYLLATHDAYAWVTGAEWEDTYTAGSPMALLLASLSDLTKVRAANLAFWLPAVLAALSAIPITLWAAHLGARPGASLAAGVLGSLAPPSTRARALATTIPTGRCSSFRCSSACSWRSG